MTFERPPLQRRAEPDTPAPSLLHLPPCVPSPLLLFSPSSFPSPTLCLPVFSTLALIPSDSLSSSFSHPRPHLLSPAYIVSVFLLSLFAHLGAPASHLPLLFLLSCPLCPRPDHCCCSFWGEEGWRWPPRAARGSGTASAGRRLAAWGWGRLGGAVGVGRAPLSRPAPCGGPRLSAGDRAAHRRRPWEPAGGAAAVPPRRLLAPPPVAAAAAAAARHAEYLRAVPLPPFPPRPGPLARPRLFRPDRAITCPGPPLSRHSGRPGGVVCRRILRRYASHPRAAPAWHGVCVSRAGWCRRRGGAGGELGGAT